MSEEVLMYYFDGRGRAELVRMALCAANIQYREVDLETRQQFVKMIEDGELEFKSVPMLRIDGMKLVQTNAILRYIARIGGLAGKTDIDSANVDKYYEGSREFAMPFVYSAFTGTSEDVRTKCGPNLTKYLPIYEQALESNGTGYLVGSGLTLADLGLMEALLYVVDYFGDQKLDNYPHIKQYLSRISGLERMQYYIKHIRKPMVDDKYITTVKAVLNF